MMSAAHYKLDNLIAIVDVNNQQADGPSRQMMGFAERARAKEVDYPSEIRVV
jgi:transketolase N-terminal domain/subunit